MSILATAPRSVRRVLAVPEVGILIPLVALTVLFSLLNPAVGADRRECVAHQLPVHGNEVRLAGQGLERLEIRRISAHEARGERQARLATSINIVGGYVQTAKK